MSRILGGVRWCARTRVLCLVLGLVCLSLFAPFSAVEAQAQSRNIKMEVRAGFSGFYKEYKWMPIQVTLSNDDTTAPPVKGRIEVSFANFTENTTLYQRDVDLVAPYRKTYWIYVVGPSSLAQIQVRLVNSTNVLGLVAQDIRGLNDGDFLLGVLSDDSSALKYLNSEVISKPPSIYSPFVFLNNGGRSRTIGTPTNSPRVTVAHLLPGDLPPNAAGMYALDGLVVSDLGNVSYGSDQAVLRSSVSSWLATGKALIVAGDSPLRRAAFLNALLPISSNGGVIKASDLSEIQKFAQAKSALPDNLSLADTSLVTGNTGAEAIVKQGQIPLIATRPYGVGRSWFVGLNIAALQNWDGANQFWISLLSGHEPRSDYASQGRRPAGYDADNWIYWLTPNPQNSEPPTVLWIVFILFVYIMLIGPVSYSVLSRMDKREWLWVAVPAITLVFCVITYIASGSGRGSDLLLNKVTVITAGQDNDGQMNGNFTSIIGVYSNSRNEFEIKVDENNLANGIFGLDNRRYTYVTVANQAASDEPMIKQGPGGTLGRSNLALGSARGYSFENEMSRTMAGGVVADVSVNNGTLTGTLQNNSDQTWEDVAVFVSPTEVYRVGTIKPKEQRQLNVTAISSSNVKSVLVETLVGITNVTLRQVGTPSNYYFDFYRTRTEPNSQRAAALETLFGPNGEGLPRDSKRVWLVGFSKDKLVETFKVQGRSVTSSELAVLFEGLTVR